MGVLLIILLVAWPTYRAIDHYRITHPRRTPDQRRTMRWVKGRGPDPTAAMFTDGVPTWDGNPYDIYA